jgi:hypothetical protein
LYEREREHFWLVGAENIRRSVGWRDHERPRGPPRRREEKMRDTLVPGRSPDNDVY